MAAWMAAVSSATPSPTAPNVCTFAVRDGPVEPVDAGSGGAVTGAVDETGAIAEVAPGPVDGRVGAPDVAADVDVRSAAPDVSPLEQAVAMATTLSTIPATHHRPRSPARVTAKARCAVVGCR